MPGLFQSDVPAETDFLIDAYGESDDVSVGHRMTVLDIEVDSTGGYPKVDNPKQKVTAIALYDAVTKHYYCYVLDEDKLVTNRTDGDKTILSFEREEDLLLSFLTKWEEISPTIVTGWNIDGFDFPYLLARLNFLFDEHTGARLSSIGIAYYNQYKQKVTIAGVNCIDYYYLYKQYAGKNLPNYRLDTVGMEELKIGKVKFDGSIDDLKKTDINKFIEYNLHDVVLVVKMNEKLQFIELAMNICHVCHTGYEEFNISGKILEGALLTYLRRKHLVAPNKNLMSEEEVVFSDDDDDEDENSVANDKVGFKGAYVKDPIPGRYEWICSADINSLYPSTIMSLNISPETKICVIPDWSSEKLVKKSQDKIEFAGEEYTYEEFSKEIVESNLSVSANGVVYDQGKLGCIPDILKKWFSERLEYKKKMKDASDSKDKAGEVFWKRRQHVQKILLNSLYGVLGLPSFRFYDLDNALAVTATGQEIIKTSAKLVNTWFNKRCNTTEKDYVVYIDTDSLYLDIKALAVAEGITDIKPFAIQTIGKVSDDLNNFYKIAMVRMFNSTDNRIKIASDVVAIAAFWIKKKKYAMQKVYDMELNKDIDKLEVKGLDVVRSSFPKKFRSFMETMLQHILKNTPKKEVDTFVLDFKKQIKTFDIQDVAKNTSVKFVSGENAKQKVDFNPRTREPFHFIKGSTAQCKAALAYNDILKHFKLKETEPILSGGKIKWVYLKDNSFGLDGLAFKDDGKDPVMVMDMINTYADRNQIWEKELVKKLTAFYEAMNWEIFREEQATIDNFFSFE
jgi:DNA polymerase elongation subunit (family B)